MRQIICIISMLALSACGGSGIQGAISQSAPPAISNAAPLAKTNVSLLSPAVGQPVTLDGSASSDPDGDALTYKWELVTAPVESNMDKVFTGSTWNTKFDAAGRYSFTLTVSDGKLSNTVTSEQIDAVNFHVNPVDFTQAVVRYNAATNAMLLYNVESEVGSNRTLYYYPDAAKSEVKTFSIPASLIRIAQISPDGRFIAAVWEATGQAEQILILDLEKDTEYGPYDLGPEIWHMWMGDDGFVFYTAPRDFNILDVYEGDITVTNAAGAFDRFPTQFRYAQTPDGSRVYEQFFTGTRDFMSVRRFDLGSGTIKEQIKAVGDYPIDELCSGIWVGASGKTLINDCGTVLESSPYLSVDMKFRARLSGGNISIVSATASARSKLISVIARSTSTAYDPDLSFYEYDTGRLLGKYVLTENAGIQSTGTQSTGEGAQTWYARNVFAHADTDMIRVFVQDRPTQPTKTAVLTLYRAEYLPQ